MAFYLKDINDNGEHDFVVPVDEDGVVIDEGFWDHFVRSPQRQAQLAANDVSYTWDRLIETFNSHILEGTQYYTTEPDVKASEKLMRFLAKESRIRRRSLAKLLLGLIGQTPRSQRATRVILPLDQGNPYYVFLLLPHLDPVPDDEYREVRRRFLQACCMVTKLKFPDAHDIIGIATETGANEVRSEDALYYDTRHWTEKDEAEATSLQHDLNLLTDMRMFHGTEMEYPTTPNQSTNSVV